LKLFGSILAAATFLKGDTEKRIAGGSERHIPAVEHVKEATRYRHAWWLIVAGLTGGNQSDFECSRAGWSRVFLRRYLVE